MKHLLTNLRLATGTVFEHLADDPVLLMLQVSRRLPARMAQPLARAVRTVGGPDSVALPALLSGLITGAESDVVRRLESAAKNGKLTPDQAVAMADIALVANRPDVADVLLSRAGGARRRAAVAARRHWYSGEMTAAVEALNSPNSGSEKRQRERLAADLQILEGWRPALTPVDFQPLPKRVLHVLTNSLPHTASGYAQRSHSILCAQRDAGWETLAVTRIGYPVQVGKLTAGHRDVVDGIVYQRLIPARLAPTMTGRLQQQAEALLKVVLESRPSILHTTTHHVNALVTRAVAEAVGIPWVYEVRGQLADTWAATRGPEARESERYRRFQQREAEAARMADLVVTLGESMKENIVSAGIPAGKVLVAPNAVGGEFLAEPVNPSEARRTLGLAAEGQYIGTISSLVGYEGIDDLVAAFGLVAAENPAVKLLIVGDGVALPGLREQAKTLGLGERVRFTGRVPRSQAHLYHQALDIFVVPRKDLTVTRDVTPLKPVEAMASARPVVASRLPALMEIVGDKATGLLTRAEDPADLADAISQLLASEDQRFLFGTAGRKKVLETRTWASNAQVMSAAYMNLMEIVH